MVTPTDREAAAQRAATQAAELAKEVRAVGLDTLGYLLDCVVLEAKQHAPKA